MQRICKVHISCSRSRVEQISRRQRIVHGPPPLSGLLLHFAHHACMRLSRCIPRTHGTHAQAKWIS
jgi:hypothetical protein